MREVRHIVRQNGNLVEEIIAVRSGRLVKYVKKNSRGIITYGSYRLPAKRATEKKKEMKEKTENKEGLLESVLKVLSPKKKEKES